MVLRPNRALSLCAGGGGLDLGLHLAEPGFQTAGYVEWEQYPRECLIAGQRAGYFAPAPIWDDLTTFDGRPWRGLVDTVLAGYPCQPFSAAGQRKGADDERHLWPDVARVIRECEPTWVLLENVAGHVSLGAETVLRELWDMGWTPAAGLFSAQETGAAHERLRWFCVAYRNNGMRPLQPQGSEPDQRGWFRDSGTCLEPAAQQRCGEGRAEHGVRGGRDAATCSGRAMADASGAGPQGREQPRPPDERNGPLAPGSTAECSRPLLHAPGPSDAAAWRSVLDHAPDLAPALSVRDVKRAANDLAALVAEGRMAESEAQSVVCGMADGLAARSRALRLLGNGVHPLAAGHAWRSLAAAHGLRPVDLEAADRSYGAGTDGDVLKATP